LWESGNTVETVALLSKLKTDNHIDVELDMDELDLTAAERKATKPVNPISASISNTFLKKANWKNLQLFGNSEQLLLTGKNIIQSIIILI